MEKLSSVFFLSINSCFIQWLLMTGTSNASIKNSSLQSVMRNSNKWEHFTPVWVPPCPCTPAHSCFFPSPVITPAPKNLLTEVQHNKIKGSVHKGSVHRHQGSGQGNRRPHFSQIFCTNFSLSCSQKLCIPFWTVQIPFQLLPLPGNLV